MKRGEFSLRHLEHQFAQTFLVCDGDSDIPLMPEQRRLLGAIKAQRALLYRETWRDPFVWSWWRHPFLAFRAWRTRHIWRRAQSADVASLLALMPHLARVDAERDRRSKRGLVRSADWADGCKRYREWLANQNVAA